MIVILGPKYPIIGLTVGHDGQTFPKRKLTQSYAVVNMPCIPTSGQRAAQLGNTRNLP